MFPPPKARGRGEGAPVNACVPMLRLHSTNPSQQQKSCFIQLHEQTTQEFTRAEISSHMSIKLSTPKIELIGRCRSSGLHTCTWNAPWSESDQALKDQAGMFIFTCEVGACRDNLSSSISGYISHETKVGRWGLYPISGVARQILSSVSFFVIFRLSASFWKSYHPE